jgi:integrase
MNQYLALPYLRGLGWSVQHIDDDAFEATALKRYRGKQHLSRHSRMRSSQSKNQVETWVRNEVELVIASCDPSTAVGKRDRAILLLLARLGLRAGDLVQLRLGDIDWGTGNDRRNSSTSSLVKPGSNRGRTGLRSSSEADQERTAGVHRGAELAGWLEEVSSCRPYKI